MASRLVSLTDSAPHPRVIVPPGWAAIAVSADNGDTARRVFREAWTQGPRDSIGPFIHRLEEWLVSVLDDARDAGCFRVILPMGVPWQVPVSTAISLSFAPVTDALTVLIETMLDALEWPTAPAQQTTNQEESA